MKFKSFIESKKTAMVTFFISIFAAMLIFSMMHGFIYIDVVLFNGFCLTLCVLFLISIALNFALLVFNINNVKYKGMSIKESKAYDVIICINIGFTVFFVIFDLVSLIISSEALYAIWLNFLKIAPVALTCVLLLFLVFFSSTLDNKKCKKIIATLLCVAIVLCGILSIFPVSIYKFVSSPMVLDRGDGYSIVFATTDDSIAYVEYQYGNETIVAYDEYNGKKNSSRIHSVYVPYEHLKGNSYKVVATRVIQELSYGGRLGKTISSSSFTFNAPEGDLEVLSISDWHTHNSKVYKAVEHLGDYNSVILLGDCAAGLNCQEEIIEYMIKLGGNLTNGSMPIIWARGNHETRGVEAKNLSRYLGLEEFYYTTQLGDVNFIVLDSAEDKEDSHPEYAGMNNFEGYRENMISWLETLPNDEGKYLVLSHDVELCIEEDLQERALLKMEQIKVPLIIGGHTHELEYIDSDTIDKFVDGGHNNGIFVASKLTISGNNLSLLSMDNKGNKIYENTLNNLFS